ncbi:MAG: NAD(P)H-hydrate dehydratase [Candidatus Eiseniibacteriota bacterium]|nr:MAG: NAD(P)H-hydrate dehydratase [Candidatus Eisenbacteria bacterium]
MKIATPEQMRNIDAKAIDGLGIPGLTLMEHAGRGVVAVIEQVAGDINGRRFAVVCGKGNNGGDGFVVSRLLREKGARAKTFLLGRREEVSGDAKVNMERFASMGGGVTELTEDNISGELAPVLNRTAFVVDAIYGTGFTGTASGVAARAIELINSSEAQVFSVDVPSGLDCGTARTEGPCVRAHATATLALLKKGLVFFPGRKYAGDIFLVDIGIPDKCVEEENIQLTLMDNRLAREWFPRREPDAHKGDCGKIAVVGGSVGLTGAVALCSMAAMRTGAGLVTAAVPNSLNDILEAKMTEAMTRPLLETSERTISLGAKDAVLNLMGACDVLAFGPGLSRNAESAQLARTIVPYTSKPTVLDADGLNAFVGHTDLFSRAGRCLIITPHVVEMSRLSGQDPSDIENDRVSAARSFSEKFGIVVLLKGAPTVIAHPDGETYVNPTGNAGLASGGSGDVLTGIIAGLLGQRVSPVRAAVLGAYLHGLAADMAKEGLGEEGMIAGDLVELIPEAIWCLRKNGASSVVRVREIEK